MDISQVKLVVTDMDGTLLNSKHQVSNRFFKLHEQFEQKGIHFAAASGRQYYSILDKLDAIKNDITIIADNGSYVKHKEKEMLTTVLPNENIQEIIPLIRDIKNANIILSGKNKAYVESNNTDFIATFSEFYNAFEIVDDLTKISHDTFIKIAIHHYEDSEANIYPIVKHLEKDLQVKVSGKNWLDLSHNNANKGYALKQLQKKLGITEAETMVFGDYNNDLEMLRLGHFSFAMANAHQNVLKIANYKTKSNDEHGVELILDQLLRSK